MGKATSRKKPRKLTKLQIQVLAGIDKQLCSKSNRYWCKGKGKGKKTKNGKKTVCTSRQIACRKKTLARLALLKKIGLIK